MRQTQTQRKSRDDDCLVMITIVTKQSTKRVVTIVWCAGNWLQTIAEASPCCSFMGYVADHLCKQHSSGATCLVRLRPRSRKHVGSI